MSRNARDNNIETLRKNSSVSTSGTYVVLVKIGGSRDSSITTGLKLAYPNECGLFFTSHQVAENYIKWPPDLEVDLKRSGGIIMTRL